MATATRNLSTPLPADTTELISVNIDWLRQALSLLARMDDATYNFSPELVAPHRVGGHLRHVLEFYECFLDGVESSYIDYDARQRDPLVETSRQAAASKVCSLIRRLDETAILRRDSPVFVRMESSETERPPDVFLLSSMCRELQALSSHTIHHFALIAMTLRVMGFPVGAEFGMSPSTLRYRASLETAAQKKPAASQIAADEAVACAQ